MRLARCAASASTKGFRLRTKQRCRRRTVVTAIALLAALPAHACWDAANRYGVSSAALRDRAHRIGTRPAGRRTQPQRHPRHRAHADQLGVAAHAGRPRHRRARSLRPCTSIHVGAWILAGNVQRPATRGMRSVPTTPPIPLRRAYVDKVRRHLRSADDGAHRAPATAPPVPHPRGDHRAPVVATCPDRSPEHFPATHLRHHTMTLIRRAAPPSRSPSS